MRITSKTTEKTLNDALMSEIRDFLTSHNTPCPRKRAEALEVARPLFLAFVARLKEKEANAESARKAAAKRDWSESSHFLAFVKGVSRALIKVNAGLRKTLKKASNRLNDWKTIGHEIEWVRLDEIKRTARLYGKCRAILRMVNNTKLTAGEIKQRLKDYCNDSGYIPSLESNDANLANDFLVVEYAKRVAKSLLKAWDDAEVALTAERAESEAYRRVAYYSF